MRSEDHQGFRWKQWAILIMGLFVAFLLYSSLFGSPEYKAGEIAAAETRMWQHYYSEDHLKLGIELIAVLRAHYGLSVFEAKKAGELFASASKKFQPAQRGEYDVALPDLIAAYSIIEKASELSFSPEEVAEAELAWWVMRRTPGEDSSERVGQGVAHLYALIYGREDPALERAGLLRAQAASLRDAGGSQADWVAVEKLLHESYAALEPIATGI